jgi:carbonic anhydrase
MKKQNMSSEEAVRLLKEGNARYRGGNMAPPDRGAAKRLLTFEKGQNPFAVVVACSDSRVPVEILFDRGIGDIFVVRVAGNTCGVSETASIEYAVAHLETPVVVILGHSRCGAVTAVAESHGSEDKANHFVQSIGAAVGRVADGNPELSGQELVEAATVENVWHQMDRLLDNSPVVKQAVDQGSLTLLGACYDIKEGNVNWLDRAL